MDGIFDNADRAGARFEASNLPGGWDTLMAHAYYTRVDHWMTDELRTSGAGKVREYSMGTRAKTETIGGRAELSRGSLTAGLEASRRNWNTQTMLAMQSYAVQSAMPDVTIDVAGAFATYSAEIGARWRLEAGARLDRAESAADPDLANTALSAAYHGTRQTRVTDTLPTGYLRARWRDGSWSAVAGAGHSARLPDQQERFYALKRMGSDWVGNPSLSPSRNTGFDSELRYTRRGAEFGVSAFAYRVDDAIRVYDQARIAMVPGVMNTIARSYTNVDALTRGLEAAATVPLAPSISLATDLSLVRGTVRGASRFGSDLPEMPPARLRLRLRFDRARWNAAVEAVGSAKQDRVAADLRELPTEASAVVNVRGGWRLRGINVIAAVDNVFDTFYAEHLSYQRDPFRNGVRVYEPGRTASLSMAARF
jgi:iron complex outermembrane receptor protein